MTTEDTAQPAPRVIPGGAPGTGGTTGTAGRARALTVISPLPISSASDGR